MKDVVEVGAPVRAQHEPMRLYHAPGPPSQASLIALVESGIPFELVKVRPGSDAALENRLLDLTPFGSAPVLEFANGLTLRSAPAIMEFVADLAPSRGLAPECGTLSRVRLAEWMHFVSSEIQPQEGSERQPLGSGLRRRLAWIDLQLANHTYLLDAGYSIADIYLWTLWSRLASISSGAAEFDNIGDWWLRISTREGVRAALRAER